MHNEFPIPSPPRPISLAPTIDPEVVASTPPPAAFSSDTDLKDEELPDADDNGPPPNSQSSTKENDAPTDIAAARPPPVPAFEINHTSQQPQLPADSIEMQQSPLPPDLLSLYTTSTHMLEKDFAHSPPYTIQRLAELVLYPRKHYRFLPAYLRALDRIVSVSSPISDFPLPAMHSAHSGFITNGDTQVNGITERDGLGSDESLGGALLTPIPWLKHNTLATAAQAASQGSEGELRSESLETIDGPHGAGSIETVTVTVNGVPSATSIAHTSPSPAAAPTSPTLSDQSDASSSSSSTEAQLREQGGITQGELLRQEQEAGVIPKNSPNARRSLMAGGAMAVGREPALAGLSGGPEMMEEEHPHARGPEEIGMEDMGPQHPSASGGLDMEAAVGRGRSKSPQPEHVPAPALVAEAEAEAAEEDEAGRPGKDPADVEKDVEMLKEAMDLEKTEEVKDADGDVMLADADGRPVDEKGQMEVTGDLGGADAADATTL